MNKNRIMKGTLAALLLVAISPDSTADWQADQGDRLQLRAARAIDRIRTEVERSHPYFEDAYAMAVVPGITRISLGFGAAYGKGVVIEQDEAIGTVSCWQGSSGIQAGFKNFAMILFFKDKESLESLKRGEFQFTGQAGIDIATFGVHGTPTYNEGVAIIPLTKFGLMAEFAAAGTKYNFRAYAE